MVTLSYFWRYCGLNSKHDIETVAVESKSTPLSTPHTKFEVVSSKDLKGDRIQAKMHVSQQICYFRPPRFWLVVSMKMSLTFLESQCNDLFKNLFFTTLWWTVFELGKYVFHMSRYLQPGFKQPQDDFFVLVLILYPSQVGYYRVSSPELRNAIRTQYQNKFFHDCILYRCKNL